MSLPLLNGTARVIAEPELRFAASGKAVVKVRLAFNARKKDSNGGWVDGDTFYVTGTAFDQAAENLAESLQRGMEVVVSGRLRTDEWETREGEKRSGPALLIDAIGPSLRFATATVAKSGGSGSGRQDFQQARQAQQPAGEDPWATASASGGGWGSDSAEAPF